MRSSSSPRSRGCSGSRRRRRLVGARRGGRHRHALARARDRRVGTGPSAPRRRAPTRGGGTSRRGRSSAGSHGRSPDRRSDGLRASSGAPTPGPCRRRWPPTSARSTWSSCAATSSRDAPATCSSLLAPYNSSNYPQESLSLVPQDPRTSHASVWMYLERIPLVVHAPGHRRGERLRRARDARRSRPDDRAADRLRRLARRPRGSPLPLATSRPLARPKVVVTFVIDGGGWNVLDAFPDDWPNLKALMGESANFRNAIMGSFPAVTACAHATIGTGTFPNGTASPATTSATSRAWCARPTTTPGTGAARRHLAARRSPTSGTSRPGAWVGQIGYQVWHLGTMGFGGRDRPADDLPVGVFWDEDGTATWQPHNPELYRLPASMPSPETYQRYLDEFDDPGWDAQFTPVGRQSPCCRPPIVRYQGDVIEAAFDSEPIGERRDQPALHDLQVARLHGPRLRHGFEVDRVCSCARSTSSSGRLRRDARRAVPRRVRADRHRRPRTMPAARLGRRGAARSDPARAISSSRASRV